MEHLEKAEIVLQKLQDKDLRANLRKPFFIQTEVEYLRFLLIWDGVKPQPKKVESIEKIKTIYQ